MRLFIDLLAYFLCVVSITFLSSATSQAQTQIPESWQGVRPVGKFLTDSIKVGFPVKYSLSLKHPADMEVIFPDTSYQYAPFQWVGKDFFPTHTDASGSLDSAVYTLISFSLDSVQSLSLPVFIITRTDCTSVFSQSDSVYFHSLLPAGVDSLEAKRNLAYVPVSTYYNYGYTILIIIAVLLSLLLINVAFGKRIRRQYKLYIISREQGHFRNAFERLTRNIYAGNAVGNVENAVILWKNYMESLEDKPFSTYTTKEIIEIIPNQQLAEALQHTDRIIYGQMDAAESVRYTRILAYVAKRTYIEKRVAIEKMKV